MRPHDPLSGLPPRLLRFTGAMEAWLEEMPIPRDPQHVPRPYTSLNDAAARHTTPRADLSILRPGNRKATLWYFTLEFLQQLWPLFLQPDGSGVKLWERALLDRGCTIQSTHTEVGEVHYPQAKNAKARGAWLKDVFSAMQASKWTPDGEARSLLVKRRLSHASMSIGDAIQIGGELFVAGLSGFVPVKEGDRLLPPREESDAVEPEEPSPPPASGKAASKKGAGREGGAGRKGGKGGRGGKGKGKGKGSGEGDDGARKAAKPQRAKEPAPAVAAVGDRADRRKLRAQLQARREQLQGGH